MYINYVAVLVASVLQFIFGAVWYGPIFGNLWGKMHGHDSISKEEQARLMKGMAPYLAIQFVLTLVTTFVFALLLNGIRADWNIFGLAGFFWLGFMLPVQVSAVIFGQHVLARQWISKKLAIMATASLVCIEIVAATLYLMH